MGRLEQEVAAAQLELHDRQPPQRLGASDLLVEQLKEEVQRLREQLRQLRHHSGTGPAGPAEQSADQNGSALQSLEGGDAHLRNRLRAALKRVRQLSLEKQELVEANNRLRAQVRSGQSGAPVDEAELPPSPDRRAYGERAAQKQTNDETLVSPDSRRSRVARAMEDRLRTLEQLQYEITLKQLQQQQVELQSARGGSAEREMPVRDTHPVDAEPLTAQSGSGRERALRSARRENLLQASVSSTGSGESAAVRSLLGRINALEPAFCTVS